MIGLLSQLGSLASLAAPASDPQSAFRPRPLSTPAPLPGADTASYDAAYANWLGSMMSGVDQSFGGLSGVTDQILGRPAQLNQPSQYYDALSGGGTGAQNARFERMYDPRWAQQSAAQSLAVDPQFGHLFGGGQASVQQFGSPQQPVPEITNDTIWAAMNATDEANANRFDSRYGRPPTGEELAGMTQTSGVSLSPELQSQALERRLAQRAESQANLNAMRMTPMDYVDPLKRMQAAYDWEYAQQEMAAQNDKNAIARLIAQAEIDARNQMMQQDQSQFDANMDFRKLQAMLQGQATTAQNRIANEQWQAGHDLEQQKVQAAIDEAQRAAGFFGMTGKDLLSAISGYRSQYGSEAGDMFSQDLSFLRSLPGFGGDDGGLLGAFSPIVDALGFGGGGTGSFPGGPAASTGPRRPTPEQATEWAKMPVEQQVVAMKDAGWTDDQILDRLKTTQPNAFGISLENPDGSSALWEAARAFPGLPMFYDDAFFGSGFQKAIFGNNPDLERQEMLQRFGIKPTAPAPTPAASLPPLQFFPPVSAF